MIQGVIQEFSDCLHFKTKKISIMLKQQEQAVTFVSKYVVWHLAVIIETVLRKFL